MVQDMESITDLEKKHVPVISAPQRVNKGETFEVVVEVGKMLEHPNEASHYIEFIELYADHTSLCRMDFTSKTTDPIMKASVSLDHIHSKLRAFARCNLHGIWEGHSELSMIE
ncbi:MAG: class II SORL domain-containing protein [Planctomycetes bacterium]|nr:class II SORL domain-containing protein [Planctomycetota bacterium]